MPKLTQNQIDVLHYVVQGYTNKQIAEHLNIGVDAVKARLRYVYRKMKVPNRVRASVEFEKADLSIAPVEAVEMETDIINYIKSGV